MNHDIAVMGFIPEIHGDGGRPVDALVTRHEIEILIEHYLHAIADIEHYHADGYSCTSSLISLRHAHARIADLVRQGAISQHRVDAIAEAVR